MIDLKVVSSKRILPIHQVAPIRGFNPPSVLVRGEDLDKTVEAYFNGILVEEFAVQSPTRLVIKIPTSQVGKKMDSIAAYSTTSVSRQSSALSMELGQAVKTVGGIDRLVQSWLMVFMTTPGSDIFSPGSGGGGKSLVGRVTDRTGKGVSADLAMAVERTKSELVRLQAKNTRLPLAEKLLSCAIEQVNFDPNTSTLSARVSIQNVLGEQANVSLR